jgi:site-specific DNA recombinase
MKGKAEQGYFPAKAPLGYKNIEDENGKKFIVIDDKKAFDIKRAFDLYLTGNYSYKRLGNVLGSEGFVDKHGKPYPPRKFEWMLKNVFYTGQFIWAGELYQGKHKSIIAKDVFYAVQARFDSSLKARKHDIQFPYTNLIKCSKCGCYLTAELHRGRNGKGEYIYYHCTGNRGGKCKNKYVRQEIIDATFQDIINNLYLPDSLVDAITTKMKEFHLHKNDYKNNTTENIQNQINRLEMRIDNLYLDKLDGKIAEEFWSKRHNQWMAEKSELLFQLEVMHNSEIKYYENMDLLLNFCRNAPLLYKEANLEQKRNIINLMCLKLFYDGSTLDIELKTVFENIRILPKSKNGAGDGVRTHVYRHHKPRS